MENSSGLLNAYRSALANVGGQGFGEMLNQAQLGYEQQAAERRRKKQEEEEARQREGNLFALNRAIEEGDEATIMRLGPKVYGTGVDFGAVAQGAKAQKERTERTRKEAELTRLLGLIPYAEDDATKRALSEQANVLQAGLSGLSPTRTQTVEGEFVPSGKMEQYTEQAPKPGTAFPVGTILPIEQARALAKERGLGGAFAVAPPGPYAPGVAAPFKEARRVIKDIPAAMETVSKTRDIMVPKTEEVPRFNFAAKADTKAALKFEDRINATAKQMRQEVAAAWKDLTDAEKADPKRLAERAALENEIDVWEADAITNKSSKGLTRPTIAFKGAKTIRGQTLEQKGQALADRRRFNEIRLGQFARSLKIKEGTLANSVRQTANAFIINTERNVILRNNTALRGEALDLLVQRYNNDTDLKVWAQSDRTQAEAGKITVAAAKTANDNVSKLPQFGKAVRDEIYASGDEARIKKFEDDYRTAVAAETTSLAQQQLDKLKKSTFKPARIERRGGAATARAATNTKPANANPAGAKSSGLAGRRDID